jgi:hypothetical protein
MVYVISYGDESPATCSGKVKGKQLKGKGKRSDESAPLVSPSDTPVYLVYHQWEVSFFSLSFFLSFLSSKFSLIF